MHAPHPSCIPRPCLSQEPSPKLSPRACMQTPRAHTPSYTPHCFPQRRACTPSCPQTPSQSLHPKPAPKLHPKAYTPHPLLHLHLLPHSLHPHPLSTHLLQPPNTLPEPAPKLPPRASTPTTKFPPRACTHTPCLHLHPLYTHPHPSPEPAPSAQTPFQSLHPKLPPPPKLPPRAHPLTPSAPKLPPSACTIIPCTPDLLPPPNIPSRAVGRWGGVWGGRLCAPPKFLQTCCTLHSLVLCSCSLSRDFFLSHLSSSLCSLSLLPFVFYGTWPHSSMLCNVMFNFPNHLGPGEYFQVVVPCVDCSDLWCVLMGNQFTKKSQELVPVHPPSAVRRENCLQAKAQLQTPG
ncbi:uncharacterized protein LOC128828967 [Malaclemys terrapin pileata]|uniref:uncharacterized protein LOC128828967 n=1 Tax=Malaclemys terrapin pileata TaxID=2991368 RepID=UPI0023A7C8B7|nr:uncharacterized protein LOC128828967 [Malaclemys terrapin pileata]XP_053869993.1 uncharacterized protein LOC128828967 [Malaclemys terrapin pileata]